MQRLSEIDLPALAPKVPPLIIDIGTALFCFGVMATIRILLQMVVPGAAPFALLYPFAVLATLLSSWRAGAITFYLGLIGVWYIVRGRGRDRSVCNENRRQPQAHVARAGLARGERPVDHHALQ